MNRQQKVKSDSLFFCYDTSNFTVIFVCTLLKNIKSIYTVIQHFSPFSPHTFISLQHILIRLGEFLLL